MMASKKPERGYTVIWIEMALLVITIILAVTFQAINIHNAHEVAMINAANAENGIYMTITYAVDMSVFSYLCTALSAALGVSVAAQFRKKRVNNVYEYMEASVDKWLRDPSIAPQATEILKVFLQTNQNNT